MTATDDQPPAHADVISILTQDHHDVLDLIATITAETTAEGQRSTTDTVIAEIVRHSVAEEMFVYPAMRRHLTDGDEVVAHDISEHADLERTMKSLEQVDAGTQQFGDLVGQLEDQLRHHAEDEEQEQFPRLREHVPPATLIDLGRRVDAAKQVAPTRPHPNSPHSELFHKTVGAGVGFVDRLRDSISGRSRNT